MELGATILVVPLDITCKNGAYNRYKSKRVNLYTFLCTFPLVFGHVQTVILFSSGYTPFNR